PSGRADLFMKHEACDKRQKHVAEGSCRKNIGEVGPGEGSVVSNKKPEQKQDTQSYPGIGDSENYRGQVARGNISDLFHSPRKQCFLDPLVPLRPRLEERFRFLVKPFAVVTIEGSSF